MKIQRGANARNSGLGPWFGTFNSYLPGQVTVEQNPGRVEDDPWVDSVGVVVAYYVRIASPKQQLRQKSIGGQHKQFAKYSSVIQPVIAKLEAGRAPLNKAGS